MAGQWEERGAGLEDGERRDRVERAADAIIASLRKGFLRRGQSGKLSERKIRIRVLQVDGFEWWSAEK